jgi:uncharacterized membrane protein affecting hemolysin expression
MEMVMAVVGTAFDTLMEMMMVVVVVVVVVAIVVVVVLLLMMMMMMMMMILFLIIDKMDRYIIKKTNMKPQHNLTRKKKTHKLKVILCEFTNHQSFLNAFRVLSLELGTLPTVKNIRSAFRKSR